MNNSRQVLPDTLSLRRTENRHHLAPNGDAQVNDEVHRCECGRVGRMKVKLAPRRITVLASLWMPPLHLAVTSALPSLQGNLPQFRL